MAIEYVDSTQLDSDLTSVANAIRAKSGGSSQLAFPAGFVSEIQAIPSGGGGATLPDEYQEVEYIENTNTARLSSDIYVLSEHGNDTIIEIEASFNSYGSAVRILVGPGEGTGNWFGVLSTGKVGCGSSNYLQNPVYSEKNSYKITYSGGITVECDGETISRAGSIVTSSPIYFFSAPNGNYACYAKIYSLKIYLGTALRRDFVPCYNKQSGEIGMYDLVSNTFFVNASSTGYFTKGSDVLSAQQALNVLLGVSE